jgi:glutaminyl-tRNA synthetase
LALTNYSDNSLIRIDRLEYHIREELNRTAPRTMVVMNPVKVCLVLKSYSFYAEVFSRVLINFLFLNWKVMIMNLEDDKVMDLDAKMWPDAPADDAASYYKV